MLSMFLDDMRIEERDIAQVWEDRGWGGWIVSRGVSVRVESLGQVWPSVTPCPPGWAMIETLTGGRPTSGTSPMVTPSNVLNIIITYATLYVSGTRLCVDFVDLTMGTCSALLLGLRRVCPERGTDICSPDKCSPDKCSQDKCSLDKCSHL